MFLHFPIFFKFFSNSRVATRLEIKPRNTFHPHPLIKDRNEFSQRLHNEIPRTRITRRGESAVSLFRRSLAPSSSPPPWKIDRRTTTKPGLLSRDFRGPRLKQKRAARSLKAKIPGRVLRDRRDRGLPFTLSCPPLRREKRHVVPLAERLNFHRYGEWPGMERNGGMVGERWLRWFDVYNFPRHFSRMNKISGVIYPGNFIVNPFPVQIFPSLFFIVVRLYIYISCVCVQ